MTTRIAVFTMHKSGSMFLHRQCEFLCARAGIAYHSPNLPASRLDARQLLTEPRLWQDRSGCIAPIRFHVDIPNVDEYQILLHLRDPRDVLVSMFYSYCFIHAGELPPDTGYRQEVARAGIDQFVLGKSGPESARYRGDYGTGGHVESFIGNVPERYRRYLNAFRGRENVTLLKYEQMVTDYPAWLGQFVRPFHLPNPEATVGELAAQSATLFPRRERDVMTHVRHVTPGDYLNKLRPETIAQLNEIYAPILEWLGG